MHSEGERRGRKKKSPQQIPKEKLRELTLLNIVITMMQEMKTLRGQVSDMEESRRRQETRKHKQGRRLAHRGLPFRRPKKDYYYPRDKAEETNKNQTGDREEKVISKVASPFQVIFPVEGHRIGNRLPYSVIVVKRTIQSITKT